MDEKILFSEQLKRTVIERLKGRGVPPEKCPMCRASKWIIGDGFLNQPVQKSFPVFSVGGPTLPCIALLCNNCGFVSLHAVGVLGLLEKEGS